MYSFEAVLITGWLLFPTVSRPAEASLRSISRVGLIGGLMVGEIVTGLHCDLTLNGLLEFFL